MVYIYKKENGNIILLKSINCTFVEFNRNINNYYPDWDCLTMIASEYKYKYKYPFIDGEKIREKTREELIILNNKLELLFDGEYANNNKIIFVPCSQNLIKPKWNKETHIWEENATTEELKEFYFDLINKYKAEILQVGFDFNGHQQKCREKDLALLGNAIAANEDTQPFTTVPVSHWSFNDNDVVEMSLEDLKRLRIAGATFVQTIFIIEARLKASSPNVQLTKQDFISKINEISEVKCFSQGE